MIRLFYSKSDSCNQFEERGDMQTKSSGSQLLKAKQCSELLMGEQLISECEKAVSGQHVSHLTFIQYESMDSDEKTRIHNCVHQWALKARNNLPSNHGIFCLVVAHLLRNAH